MIGLGIPLQVVIGGITVLTDLNPWVVAFHLLVSLAIIGLAVRLLMSLDQPLPPPHDDRVTTLAWVVFAAALLVLADTIMKYMQDRASLWDVAFSALACIPGVKGLTTLAALKRRCTVSEVALWIEAHELGVVGFLADQRLLGLGREVCRCLACVLAGLLVHLALAHPRLAVELRHRGLLLAVTVALAA